MPRFDLVPRVGAGGIRFGTSRVECRAYLGEPLKSYSKWCSKSLSDTYFGNELQLAFDDDDNLEYLEFNGPGSVDPVLEGAALLDLPADVALSQVCKIAEFDQ